MLDPRTVAIASSPRPWAYPSLAPYRPAQGFPELEGRVGPGEERNIVYELLRRLFLDLGLDAARAGTPEWNPLGALISPGQRVLVKPNLVRHVHLGGGDYQAVVTHPSLVRAVLDYAALALRGEGELAVGDAPVQSTDFAALVERSGLQVVCDDVAAAWGLPVRLVDFRLWSVEIDGGHRVVAQGSLGGDPLGYGVADLGRRSLLFPVSGQFERFRVTNYDPSTMREHHNKDVHEYLIPRTVLQADVVLNLPKLKTHHKVGLTAALKNLVGINGHKDWLPHHRRGSAAEGADEYQKPSLVKRLQTALGERIDRDPFSRLNVLRRSAIRVGHRVNRYLASERYLEGSWFGNDTLWRTVLDLNRVLIYARADGKMAEEPQRRALTVVDAIVAGEGEGPMEPDSRPTGLLVGGGSPVSVDAVLSTMIGFDFRRLPIVARAFEVEDWPLVAFPPEEIEVRSEDARFKGLAVGAPCDTLCFKPPEGWAGHIENRGPRPVPAER